MNKPPQLEDKFRIKNNDKNTRLKPVAFNEEFGE